MRLGFNKITYVHKDNTKTIYYKYFLSTGTDHWIYLRLGNKEFHLFKKDSK